jgi:hypothetical protein
VIEDVGCEIVARRVVEQLAVIPPDDAKHRVAQTYSTFNDCAEDWLNIPRRSTDKFEYLAGCGLLLPRFVQLAGASREFRFLSGSGGTAATQLWRSAALQRWRLAASRFS